MTPPKDTNTEAYITRPPGGLFDINLVRLALGDTLERSRQPTSTVTVRERLVLAALYHLLQPPAEHTPPRTYGTKTPVHTVNDFPPYRPDHAEQVSGWTWIWDYVRVNMNNPDDEPGDRRPIRIGTDQFQWMSVEETRAVAAMLLSAADRAERALTEQTAVNTDQPPRDAQGRTPCERVATGLPAYELTDQQVADIAVASGWIEDTPEARAAYLAGEDRKEEPQ